MRRLILLSLTGLVLAAAALSQQEAAKPAATPTIRAETRLVVVDAIVTDGSGKPITDLKPDELVVEENGKQQKLASVELITPSTEGPETLPPSIYSNRPEYNAPRSGYTILLIDALNTPVENQAWARQQLLRYAAAQLQPGRRVAVYALGNTLYRLQTFTDDPELLKAAIQRAEQYQLETKTGGTTAPGTRGPLPGSTTLGGGAAGSNPMFQNVLNRISTFQAEQSMFNAEVAIDTTTAALRALARMMLGVPGRKNLVWITAGVPIALRMEDMTVTTVLPERPNDPSGTAPPPLQREASYDAYAQNVRIAAANDVKEVASLLQLAQISIYAVDARGLFSGTSQTVASNSGLNSSGLLVMGQEYGRSVQNAGNYITTSQANMKSIASETAGRYYVNRNDIDEAVAAASRDGGTYYSIAYYPEKKKFDGSFRKIKISVKRPSSNVRHRLGYYAVDFSKKSKKDRENELGSAVRLSSFAPSTLVMFDVQVVPPAPAANAKVPVTFLLRPGNFTAEDVADGGKHIDLDFFVTAATPDGRSAASTGMKVDTKFSSEQFQRVSTQGILLPMDVTLPPGNYSLLLAVRDNPTGMLGTLNVPLQLRSPAP
ncbi:MAG: VWA domain-containing protein [Acidobacteriota bacterium]|nr:VWA domain-containing protein [Acidobacteriota bacterium]